MDLTSLLQRTVALLQQKNYADASTLIREVLTRHSRSADAWRIAGMIGRATADPQAEQCLRHSLTLHPDHPEALNTLAGLMRDQQREIEAEHCYRKALAIAPHNTAIRTNLCRLLLAQERPAMVVSLTNVLAAETPATLWRQRGEALLQTGRAELALETFDRALAVDPHPLGVHGCLRALLEMGRFDEARDIAVVHAATNTSFAMLLTRIMTEQGDWTDATELALATARAQPDVAEACFMASQLLWMQHRREAVAALLQELEPRIESPATLLTCVEIRRGMEQFDEAHEALDRAESRFGASVRSACIRADLALAQEDGPRALRAGEAAFAIAPQDIHSRAAYVQALLVNGHGDTALPVIEETLELAPDHQLWLALWGDCLRQLGDPRYQDLVDLATMVRPFRLDPPPGYGSIEDFNRELAASLENLHQAKTHPLDQSLRMGSQTSLDLRFVSDPVIKAFLEIIKPAITTYVAGLPVRDDHPLYGRRSQRCAPSGMWSVKLQPGGRHVNHIHPQGWLSSAYYVDVPAADAGNPDSGALRFGVPRYRTPRAECLQIVPATPGTLVLFPSYLWHGTVPARTGTRLTIAFDVTPLGGLT